MTSLFEPAPFQIEDMADLDERDWSANWSEMGCIAGTERIRVLTKSGKVKDWTLREAYLGFNKIHSNKAKNWKSDGYKTLALNGLGRIAHAEILAITNSGKKRCLKLTLEDERSITLTPDHQVLAYNPDCEGTDLEEIWTEVQYITIGQTIRVKGRKGEKHDSKRTSYKYVRVPEKAGNGAGLTRDYFREHRVVADAPDGLDTHHLDETSENNDLSNLRVITRSEHSRTHAPTQIASYDSPPMAVVKIEDVGEQDTYDVSMGPPWFNFVANGIVVHNCYKTSTVCWMIERWAKQFEMEKPKVLIVTTRSGKGTYFKHVPALLPHYEVLNVHTSKVSIVLDDFEIPYGIPSNLDNHALIFVAHYNVFSKRKKKKKDDEPEEEEVELTSDMILQQVIAEMEEDQKKAAKGEPILDQLKKIHWDIIILDEAHRIKERGTTWTKELKKLKGTVKHVMTGTGFINNPAEIWSLLHFLNRKEFTSYWRFRETFCDEDWEDGFRRILGVNPAMAQEFRNLVRTIGPRRTKIEVFPNLPRPIYSPVEVELNPTQRAMYDGIRDELYALDQAGTPIFAPNVLSALQRLRQVSDATPRVVEDYYDPELERRIQKIELVEPSSKLDALMEIIEGLEWDDDRRDQLVVFCNFKDPIKLALERFKPKYDKNGRLIRRGIPYIHMKQSDNDRVRYQKWAIEFPKKEHQVFICTLQLGSESISLTSATTCVFIDRSWSPKDNSQGESRVWRPGQESVANMIHINAKDTVDERVLRKVKNKQRWFDQIFGDEPDDETTVDGEDAEFAIGLGEVD